MMPHEHETGFRQSPLDFVFREQVGQVSCVLFDVFQKPIAADEDPVVIRTHPQKILPIGDRQRESQLRLEGINFRFSATYWLTKMRQYLFVIKPL